MVLLTIPNPIRRRSAKLHVAILGGILLVGVAIFLLVQQTSNRPEQTSHHPARDNGDVEPAIPRQSSEGGFVQSAACRECHPEQHASWHDSFHRTMTQLATPETVIAPFNNTELEFQGQFYRLERNADQFFVSFGGPREIGNQEVAETSADDGRRRRRILMTTGSHHIQLYWVSEPDSSKLIELPFYYHIAEQRWILRDDTMLRPPDEPHIPSVWNVRCIKCHSVAGAPGRDPASGKISSRAAELGIACEACHGPGKQHAAFYRKYPQGTAAGLAAIVNPQNLDSHASTQVCGRCHSSSQPIDYEAFLTDGIGYLPGDDLHRWIRLDRFDPNIKPRLPRSPGSGSGFVENYATDGYWKDGTCRVGGDEYNALIESPCYKRGELSCLSCHSLHKSDPNDQLTEEAQDNRACTQCHRQPKYNDRLEEHTHHAPKSEGSLCYNCHMPYTSYALLTAMRTHRIDSPSVTNSVQSGRPNACNLCHIDNTLKWASEYLTTWHGLPETRLSNDEEHVAASLLWLLKGDAAQRIIATWHLGWRPALQASGDDWQAAFLAFMLDDPYSAIRFVAAKSLKRLPGFEDFTYDFVGPPEDRMNAVTTAHELWRKTRRFRHQADRSPILMRPDGLFRSADVERLLRERDDQPLSIAE